MKNKMFHEVSSIANNKDKPQSFCEISEATKCPIAPSFPPSLPKGENFKDSEKRQHMYPCTYKGDEELLSRKERYEP